MNHLQCQFRIKNVNDDDNPKIVTTNPHSIDEFRMNFVNKYSYNNDLYQETCRLLNHDKIYLYLDVHSSLQLTFLRNYINKFRKNK